MAPQSRKTWSDEARNAAGKFASSRRNSLVLLMAIGVLSAIALAWAWYGKPSGNTLRYEVAKTALQVIAVAGLGSLAALATFTFQHSREQEIAQRDDRRARLRRGVENARDTRARQDDLLRALLQETLVAYNSVKRLRRLLRAETAYHDRGPVRLDVYDRHMADLIDQQLKFEQLKRRAPFIADERLRPSATGSPDSPVKTSYEKIEKYLNKVIGEYEGKPHLVVADPTGLPLNALPKLSAFLGSDFASNVSNQIDTLIETLQAALLQTLDMPDPEADTQP